MARVDIVAILGSLTLLATVVELVRRRHLAESYSLLWISTAVMLVILALWRDLLHAFASFVGIYYPPAALFLVGFGFVLLILLQFSIVISSLTRKNRILAQQMALLDAKVERLLDKREGDGDG